jgi:hypothetical protein
LGLLLQLPDACRSRGVTWCDSWRGLLLLLLLLLLPNLLFLSWLLLRP